MMNDPSRYVRFYYRNESHPGLQLEAGYFVGYSRPGQILVSDKPRHMVNPRRHDLAHIRHITAQLPTKASPVPAGGFALLDSLTLGEFQKATDFFDKLTTGGFHR